MSAITQNNTNNLSTAFLPSSQNFFYVVPDSQFYSDLEMIKRNLENLKEKARHPNSGNYMEGGICFYNGTSLEDDIRYIIKGLENTIEKYQMVEKKNE